MPDALENLICGSLLGSKAERAVVTVISVCYFSSVKCLLLLRHIDVTRIFFLTF